ncbi:PREDICTED: citrate lyase subunit beta-like protein, mitochondrial [Acropora digitifera]|uniref:citrate lyase subunit beta-like protein, mitochondrial n=1 Tax=Acropora digitifera TaxID=70779 RepID=UPI00077ADE58|nr:PREDICTED: citrate lyase subunit beta-like protein, mitochondrial [Acropora digitifera]
MRGTLGIFTARDDLSLSSSLGPRVPELKWRYGCVWVGVLRKLLKSDAFRNLILKRRLCDVKSYTPRRSFLYIPGNEERKVSKASGLKADCVVLDCEDGVAVNKKEDARNSIHNLLGQLNFGSREVCVRINSIETGLAGDDLAAAMTATVLPHSIVVPKVDSVEHLDWLDAKILGLKKSRGSKLGLITQVESAAGLLNLRAICEHGILERRMFKFEALVFGSDDFLVSLGATRTQDVKELIYARQSVVVHAKAYGLQAIDMVYINFKGMRFLYTGKQIIHPGQIDVVNRAFSPSKEKLNWASAVVTAFEQHEKEGKGAIDFHGCMIDMPTVQQARNVLRLAELTQAE